MKTQTEKTAEPHRKAIAHEERQLQKNLQTAQQPAAQQQLSSSNEAPIQRVVYPTMAAMWNVIEPTTNEAAIRNITNADTALAQVYTDVENHLAHFNFNYVANQQPEADIDPAPATTIYGIDYGLRAEQPTAEKRDIHNYIGAILHEMLHITAAVQYNTNVPAGAGAVGHLSNAHLPASTGAGAANQWGVDPNQANDPVNGIAVQAQTMYNNWENLRAEVIRDNQRGDLSDDESDYIQRRINYAQTGPGAIAHNETVLTDIMFTMRSNNLHNTRTYQYAHRALTEANNRRNAGAGAVAPLARAPIPWCYITTACVEFMGLGDDCEELTVLRNFRDNYLAEKENGKALIQLYYQHAPAIVAAIRRREDEEEILKRLYLIIRQCVDAIKNGDNSFAFEMYCKMMRELKAEFIPEVELVLQ